MSLLYPGYAVLSPARRKIAMPSILVYQGSILRRSIFLNNWLLLRQTNGVTERLHDHWMLGKCAERSEPAAALRRTCSAGTSRNGNTASVLPC